MQLEFTEFRDGDREQLAGKEGHQQSLRRKGQAEEEVALAQQTEEGQERPFDIWFKQGSQPDVPETMILADLMI